MHCIGGGYAASSDLRETLHARILPHDSLECLSMRHVLTLKHLAAPRTVRELANL